MLPLLLLSQLMSAEVTSAEPYIPPSDDTVLERVPTTDNRILELQALARALRADPQHPILAAALSRRYIEVGRRTGDPRYFGYAEAALALALVVQDNDTDLLVLRATLEQNRHEFSAALATLERAMALSPNHAQARLTRATILFVTGRPLEARSECEALATIAPPLVANVCSAQVLAATGRAQEADRMLSASLGDLSQTEAASRAWVLTTLAEVAATRGDWSLAELRLREVLATDPTDIYARSSLADLLLDQGRAAEARVVAGDDRRPDALLLRMALASRQGRDRDSVELIALLSDRFAAAKLRGDPTHRREEAIFRLHLTGEAAVALELAAQNWAVQRERPDARILLEASIATGHAGAAAPVIAWMNATGVKDHRLQELVEQLGATRRES
jgi:Flp pilus assembly protein TadD